MKTVTRILVATPLILSLGGCGHLNGLQLGMGVLGAGAALWGAHAQSESVRVQRAAAGIQAQVAQATIALNQSQIRYYQEQTLLAVAKREEECSQHLYAMNSFEVASCNGVNRTAACMRIMAIISKPELARADVGIVPDITVQPAGDSKPHRSAANMLAAAELELLDYRLYRLANRSVMAQPAYPDYIPALLAESGALDVLANDGAGKVVKPIS